MIGCMRRDDVPAVVGTYTNDSECIPPFSADNRLCIRVSCNTYYVGVQWCFVYTPFGVCICGVMRAGRLGVLCYMYLPILCGDQWLWEGVVARVCVQRWLLWELEVPVAGVGTLLGLCDN